MLYPSFWSTENYRVLVSCQPLCLSYRIHEDVITENACKEQKPLLEIVWKRSHPGSSQKTAEAHARSVMLRLVSSAAQGRQKMGSLDPLGCQPPALDLQSYITWNSVLNFPKSLSFFLLVKFKCWENVQKALLAQCLAMEGLGRRAAWPEFYQELCDVPFRKQVGTAA